MVKADLGTKRSCAACEMRFYDFNREPIVCPGCGVGFDPDYLIKKKVAKKAKPAIALAAAATDATDPNDTSDADGAELEVAAVRLDDDDIDAGDDTPVTDNADADVDDEIDADLDYDDSDNDIDEEEGGLIQDNLAADDELLTNVPSRDEE